MYSFAAKVDIGVYEQQNDDRALVGSHLLTDGEISGKTNNGENVFIAAVCDGVGGLAQGYRAAMMTLEDLSRLNRGGVSADEIRETIEMSNRRIRDIQSAENRQNEMMTTIAGIYADSDRFYVYNAGDSRVYRFRYRFFSQLSKDHSLVRDLIDMGEITPSEAKTHPQKNIINKCLGFAETVNPRVVDLSDDLVSGDIIMICSDGISDEVTDTELKEIILEHKNDDDMLECCSLICRKAIGNGSRDNMSVILIRKEEQLNE